MRPQNAGACFQTATNSPYMPPFRRPEWRWSKCDRDRLNIRRWSLLSPATAPGLQGSLPSEMSISYMLITAKRLSSARAPNCVPIAAPSKQRSQILATVDHRDQFNRVVCLVVLVQQQVSSHGVAALICTVTTSSYLPARILDTSPTVTSRLRLASSLCVGGSFRTVVP